MALSDELLQAIGDVVNKAVEDTIADLTDSDGRSFVDRLKDQPRNPSSAEDFTSEQLSIGLGRIARALAAAKGDPDRAARWAKRAQEMSWKDSLGDFLIEKALAVGDFTAGGFMVPPEFSNSIIPLLYKRVAVRRAGAQTLPLNNGQLILPKQTAGATASYVGENKPIPKSEPAGGQLVMTAKKLTALVPMSNDLLTFDAGDQADVFVRNDLAKQIGIREDLAFIRDDGTQNTPKGMRYWAKTTTATAGTSAANIETDFRTLLDNLEGADVSVENAVWFMHSKAYNRLMILRDSNGNLIYPELRTANPTIHGLPVFKSNNIPKTLGGGSNETEIYLANMEDMVIAESGGLELSVSTEASYVDGSNTISTFQNDQTVIRAIERHDFAALHEESVSVITGVTWHN